MRTIRTKVYQFSELSEQKQVTAIKALFYSEPRIREVEITHIYEYAVGFRGLKGLIARITPEGANIWLPVNQGSKNYQDSIYWFPFYCFKPANEYEFKADGTRF